MATKKKSSAKKTTAKTGKAATTAKAAQKAAANVRERLKAALEKLASEGGSSMHPRRLLVMDEPPSIDADEITDKGYINQRAVLERRAALVERLHANPPAPDVVTAKS